MFEFRNKTNTEKRIELNPVIELSRGDIQLSKGAIFQQKQWMGCCLAPSVLPDTMYFLWFPWWAEWSSYPHYFDIEIDGVLYDFSQVTNIGETQWYPETLLPINDIIKISQADSSYPHLFFRNATSNKIHVKMIKRNGGWEEDGYEAGVVIHDDGINTSVKYHDNGDIEFDLAPYIPFDQVPEEHKFIMEMDFGNSPGRYGTQLLIKPEWLYIDSINEPGLHKNDYMHVEWDDGTVWHHNFFDMQNSGDFNKSGTYVYWGMETPIIGKRTVKIHTSHPMEFMMIQNGVKVIQWGRYVTNEMYGLDVRGSNTLPAIFESMPKELADHISYLELDGGFKPDSEFNIRSIINQNTAVDMGKKEKATDGEDDVYRYRWVPKYLDWYRPRDAVGGGKFNWGTYPDDYPSLGFTDLDQLAIHFKAHKGQGVGLKVSLDWQTAHLNKMIGSHRPGITSDFIEWVKLENDGEEEIIFLLDLAAYKATGRTLNNFLMLVRGSWDDGHLSGGINMELRGWLNSSVTLGLNGLTNVPATNDFETEMMVQCNPIIPSADTNGEIFAIMDFDTKAQRVLAKPYLGYNKETFKIFQCSDALDVLVFKGEPGTSFVLTCGQGSDTGTHTSFNYEIGDSGFVEHEFTIDPTLRFYYDTNLTNSLTQAKHPINFSAPSTFDTFEMTAYLKRGIPMDVVWEVNDVAVTPVNAYADQATPVAITVSNDVSGLLVVPKLIYTSIKTGRTYKVLGYTNTVSLLVPHKPTDRLILSMPKTTLGGDSNIWFKIPWNTNLRAQVRFVTPGEYVYVPPYTNFLTYNTSWQAEGWWRPANASAQIRSDGVADTQIIEVLLYDNTTRKIPAGTIQLNAQPTGTMVQRGTYFLP